MGLDTQMDQSTIRIFILPLAQPSLRLDLSHVDRQQLLVI